MRGGTRTKNMCVCRRWRFRGGRGVLEGIKVTRCNSMALRVCGCVCGIFFSLLSSLNFVNLHQVFSVCPNMLLSVFTSFFHTPHSLHLYTQNSNDNKTNVPFCTSGLFVLFVFFFFVFVCAVPHSTVLPLHLFQETIKEHLLTHERAETPIEITSSAMPPMYYSYLVCECVCVCVFEAVIHGLVPSLALRCRPISRSWKTP